MKQALLPLFGLLIASASAHADVAKRNVLMIAGRPSHGPGQHEHNAGVQLLAKCLRENAGERVSVSYTLNGEWPDDASLAKADTILIYSDGGVNHPAIPHLAQLDEQM